MTEHYLDYGALCDPTNFGWWQPVPMTCLQVMTRGHDIVGTLHIRHDPACTKDHVKEEEE